MATNNNMEVTVNVDRVCNDALFEFAENFYKKTGVRLQRAEFDWTGIYRLGAPTVHVLHTVVLTSAGSGNHE